MKKGLLLFSLFVLSNYNVGATDLVSENYRRNSLCLGFMIEGLSSEEEASLVKNALQEYQISDKFNNHNIGWIVVDPSRIVLTEEDEAVKIKRQQ